ncbi:MAG TPA: MgtC/SapB family protein [Solirubrobacteraceae bacterium]|jgi:putative Mg2+ transporter-C (MgtC) family protein|nr:MgtC/SapB family protein [Solirubrobacteraceae bacterium]
MHFSEWGLLWRLGLALLLSTVIGVEREVRQKNAGMRTYALVGTGAALFMLVSTYGFADVLQNRLIVLDPSRVAAQVVSGIGFIGGGLIFVQRSNVRGLTTAAGVWATAGVGLAAGGDLPVLATGATAAYLLVSVGYPYITRYIPGTEALISPLLVTYVDGAGVLRKLVAACSAHGLAISDLSVERESTHAEGGDQRTVTVKLALRGRGSVAQLTAELEGLDGVHSVRAADANVSSAAEG